MTTAPLTQAENKAGTMPPWLNRTMIWLLRSPFHRMVSGSVMLITFTGRKSGKRYTIPVSYTQQGEAIIAFTHGGWSKNLRDGAAVTLRLQRRDGQGVAHAIADDPATILPYLRTHLQQLTRDLRFYAVRLDVNGQPNEADLAKAAQTSILLRITPAMTTKEAPYAVA
jgi:hypothetical protein